MPPQNVRNILLTGLLVITKMKKKLPSFLSVIENKDFKDKKDQVKTIENQSNQITEEARKEQELVEAKKQLQENPPHRCKFCGEQMTKIDDETLAQMPSQLIEDIGKYHCSCNGYNQYIATVVEEQRLKLYVAQKTNEIKKARERIFFESAFCKDITSLQDIKSNTENSIATLKFTLANKDQKQKFGGEVIENYFSQASQFNQERDKLLDYYFWPTF